MEALLPSNFTSNNIDQLSNATFEVVLNLQIKCFLIDPLVLYLCNEGCNSTDNPICYQVICHILAVIPNKSITTQDCYDEIAVEEQGKSNMKILWLNFIDEAQTILPCFPRCDPEEPSIVAALETLQKQFADNSTGLAICNQNCKESEDLPRCFQVLVIYHH